MSERQGPAHGLSEHELSEIRMLIEERTGICFDESRERFFSTRVLEQLRVKGMERGTDLLRAIRKSNIEYEALLERLLTQETSFFRYPAVYEAFEKRVLPELHAKKFWKNPRTLRIWSAGCSTGEEAYTIAMLVRQSGLFFGGAVGKAESSSPDASERWDVRIYGSDISRRCVAAARRGIYGESSFRTTPLAVRDEFFQGCRGAWHVQESIRELCHFGQMNLLDEDRLRVLGNVDAIFCRNVLIYFDARARKAAIERLYERLNPGGVLLLGHSESLLNVSTAFELLHLKDDLVYRKPPSARSPAAP